MNKLLFKPALLLIIAFNMYHCSNMAQTATCNAWTKEKAAQWFNGREWLNGLQLKPHDSINQVEFAIQYHKNKVLWDKAFDFLKSKDLASLAPGKYPIVGDSVFVSVTEYAPRDLANTKWEAHRKYIDLQYVAKGKEKIGVAPLSKATVVEPYNDTKDVANFNCPDGQFYNAQPGTFFLFFPSDAHRPSIKTDGSDTVKKVVVKIRAD